MASITTLLATDSLASSRIVINDNFNALNTEIVDVTDLLDPTSQTLSISGGIQAGGLTLANGGSNLFSVSNTDVIANVDFTAEGTVILEEGFRHSIVSATTMPAANQYIATTYVLDATALTGTNVLAAGDAGQEITLIADGGQIVLDATNIAGATAATILSNGTLTLRYVGSFWYIISQVNCTVTF
jgi:hypothetical protein